MIFDPRDRAFALSTPRPVLPAVPEETALGEFMVGLQSTFRAFQAEEQSISRDRMLGEALQPYLDAYEAETGEALTNPFDVHHALARQGLLEQAREKYTRARANPGDRLQTRLPPLPDDGELLELAKQRALQISDEAERASAVRALGSAGTVGAALGMLGGAVQDPVNVATMMLGAPAATGILRTMAAEAALGAGAEAVIQPSVARWKAELGKEHGFAEMAANVAAGAIGAAAFAGVIKGGAKAARVGYDQLRSSLTREQRQAVEALDSLDVYERRDPFELARKIARRSQRTGETGRATFGDVLVAGDSDPIEVNLERLRAEAGVVTSAAEDVTFSGRPAEEIRGVAPEGVTSRAVDVTPEGEQFVLPGAERISEREVLERRMAARDVRGGQQGLEGLELFDEGARARQADLLDLPPARPEPTPAETRALHMAAVGEAEAAVAAGVVPDGPAIEAINRALPWDEIELPVYTVQTRRGRKVRRRGPMDIVTWLRAAGGLRDDAGELAARDLTGNRPGVRGGRQNVEFAGGEGFLGRLVHPEGMRLDDATLAAWEAGYFPGRVERPTPDDLLEAIDRTLAAGNDIDRRVWSEHDASLIDRLRNRIDLDEEAHARAVLGDELVDEALEVLDSDINVDVDPGTVMRQGVDPDAPGFDPTAPAVDMTDPVEVETLRALQQELDAGDFEVLVDEIDEATGEVRQVLRSAREVWSDTEMESAALEDAAACMTAGMAPAAG